MIEGYIFDLDGTLLDSANAWDDVAGVALLSKGIQPEDDLDEQIDKMSLRQACDYMKEHYHLEETTDELITLACDIVEDRYAYEIELKPGAKEFIERCIDKHKKLCVFTAGDAALASKALARLEVLPYFQAIYSCQTIGKNKNDPESYKTIAKEMNYPISNMVVVEDAYHAMQSAKEAGFIVQAIYEPKSEKDWSRIQQLTPYSYKKFNDMEVL